MKQAVKSRIAVQDRGLTNRRRGARAVRVDQRIDETTVAGRAGRGSVNLNQQGEVDRVGLIESLHGLGDVAQFVDDGITSSGQTADDADGEQGHKQDPLEGEDAVLFLPHTIQNALHPKLLVPGTENTCGTRRRWRIPPALHVPGAPAFVGCLNAPTVPHVENWLRGTTSRPLKS